MVLFGYQCKILGGGGDSDVPTQPTSPNNPTPSPINNPSPTPPNEGRTSGIMTMWMNSPTAVQGSSCEYAQVASVAQGSSWLEPYVNQNRYFAVSDHLHRSGMGCCQSYEIEYLGQGGTDSGRAGVPSFKWPTRAVTRCLTVFWTFFKRLLVVTRGSFPLLIRKSLVKLRDQQWSLSTETMHGMSRYCLPVDPRTCMRREWRLGRPAKTWIEWEGRPGRQVRPESRTRLSYFT